ncbi:hypothetical protein NG2371_03013 [Nocardia gamkensis]|nr:hypothetical protein [Nocardia gamkensis]
MGFPVHTSDAVRELLGAWETRSVNGRPIA